MPQKLETVLKHVEEISNEVNRQLIKDYHRYLISRDTGRNYQKDNVKLIYMFAKFIGEFKILYDIKDSETIVAFLDTRRKNEERNPEQKSILHQTISWRLKMFYRWLYNVKIKGENQRNYYDISNWVTPNFVNINKRKQKDSVLILNLSLGKRRFINYNKV